MTEKHAEFDIGLLDLTDPTLLLLGDAVAFQWLAGKLSAPEEIVLMKRRAGGTGVSLRISPAPSGSELSRQSDEFSWRLSSVEAEKIARQLVALASSAGPAHAYLDPIVKSTPIQIVASLGEYDPDRVFQS